VQARLDREGFKYCRLDGTMSARLRDQALHALEEDPDCTVMLASLGVCSVGLNLVAANQVILSDSWWAPAIEDQAVDRVHRLGQTKKCSVFRLVMEGSIEERTLDIQAEKRKLMMMAFKEKDSKRSKTKASRLGDVEKLLR
jgi:SWI/SNF-related matrix-associated actin-dependent regulator of chromatin subfamily A3